VVPVALIILGIIILVIAGVTVNVPLAMVGISSGPLTVQVSGISVLTATLLFIGAVLLIVGASMYVAMARMH
jgi:hypothetical protein